jgi:hypothetical protein
VYSSSSVTARVRDRSKTMTYQHGEWRATLSLAGFPLDTLKLYVTATDVTSDSARATRRFVHDLAPTVSVAKPIDEAVAQPSILVDATCTDDTRGCAIVVKLGNQTIAGPVPSPMHAQVSLAGHENTRQQLAIYARDSVGQKSVPVARSVWVMGSSDHVVKVGAGNGPLLDARGSRILWTEPGRTIVKSLKTAVADTFSFVATRGTLIPGGVVLVGCCGSSAAVVVDRNGARSAGAYGDQVSPGGTYSIGQTPSLPNRSNLFRTNLATLHNDTISSEAGGDRKHSVADNGDVAFYKQGTGIEEHYKVWLWHDSGAVMVSKKELGTCDANPVTDGVHVVFLHSADFCPPDAGASTWMFENGTRTKLSAQMPYPRYQVNNGWIAFSQQDLAGATQVWTRSPTGESSQRSLFSSSSSLIALGSDGALIFSNGSSYYFDAPDAAPVNLGGFPTNQIVWRAGDFLLLVGTTAFRIIP